ncbi:MAG: tRNA guanosine(34) transglycosylase Tgt [Candidatus Vogelbacteria bacterium]|nr:tRNA guanosine(34) transglycosylase Tgt [Candidatus Vogelbacteria bacterium]
MQFKITRSLGRGKARVGTISTEHGELQTPAFVTVGTKATVKALSPEEVAGLGAEVVLANTYHLYLEPGNELIKTAGGLHKFMNWDGPIMTDSGGFQVFSLGAAYGTGISKLSHSIRLDPAMAGSKTPHLEAKLPSEFEDKIRLAKIDEDGVNFKSPIDGSDHRLTPEISMQIQHDLGADIIFAFDECTSPIAKYEYQFEAMERTRRWALRSLEHHRKLQIEKPLGYPQALFGIVQGGRHKDLREKSAREIGKMGFDGFGIGGSFNKEDMGEAVRWVTEILPEDKPRHLLGIGEPLDIITAIENGCDTFDCVMPTRMARNGTVLTRNGRINIQNTKFRKLLEPLGADCECSTCKSYTCAYIAHLFRAKELLAYRLASIHNLYFIINFVRKIRESLINDDFKTYKSEFIDKYSKN